MNNYISADGVNLADYNGLTENFSFDGKQYALPARTDFYVMYYNKDIFDAAGVEYPSNDWTWEEFEETAKKLTSGEGANKTYGAFFHTWQACVENRGVQHGKNTIMDYENGYDFFKPYYDMVIRMQDEGTVQDYGTLKTGNIHYSGPFAQGTVAMMPMGTWFMAIMIQKVITMARAPSTGASQPYPTPVALRLAIPLGQFQTGLLAYCQKSGIKAFHYK